MIVFNLYLPVSFILPSVLQRCLLFIRPVKPLHQNSLAMVADISGWGTSGNTLWPPHLPVSASEGATGLCGFVWKMAVKTTCVYVPVSFIDSFMWKIISSLSHELIT